MRGCTCNDGWQVSAAVAVGNAAQITISLTLMAPTGKPMQTVDALLYVCSGVFSVSVMALPACVSFRTVLTTSEAPRRRDGASVAVRPASEEISAAVRTTPPGGDTSVAEV